MGGTIGLGLVLIILMIAWVFFLIWTRSATPHRSMWQMLTFLGLLGVSAILGFMFLVEVLKWNPNPLKVNLSRFLTEDKTIYLGDIVPGLSDSGLYPSH